MNLFNYMQCCFGNKSKVKADVVVEDIRMNTTNSQVESLSPKKQFNNPLNAKYILKNEPKLSKSPKKNMDTKRTAFSIKDSAIIAPTIYFRKSICDSHNYIPTNETEKIGTQIVGSQKLTLVDMVGNILNNESVEISYLGIQGKKSKPVDRGMLKAINYFWLENSNFSQELQKVDYILHYSSKKIYDNHLFMICYIKEQNGYKIKFNADYPELSKSIFIQLTNSCPVAISKNTTITINQYQFIVNPITNCILEIVCVNSCNNKKYIYNSITKLEITIGRNKNCDISFPDDTSFSDIQCTLNFDIAEKNWLIKDGHSEPSLLGTWIFSTNPILISDGMLVKLWDREIKISCK